MPEVLGVPLAINLVAVFVGALLGTIRAGEDEHTDLVGVFTLAAALGFGGGLVRDVLLGNLPPAAFRDPRYLMAAAAATIIGAIALFYLRKLAKVLWALDTLAIGLFACVGANAAVLAGLQPVAVVLIGTCASVGGVIIADVLQGRPSSIMYVGPPNAVAGLAGAATYTALYPYLEEFWVVIAAVVVTLAVRLTGPVFHLTIPQPRRAAYQVKIRRERERKDRERTLRRAQRNSKRSEQPPQSNHGDDRHF
ncbi:trimeric intracellular cation channel family protein [Demequina globuliformis]|uniref:trimeric intracellular cation channel family protein n=1 Tax=Demequina globuliformis TaxID=676202 RepID=UPI000783869C|nr:TRIC cation channel family protein [Demequina globuliformis]